MALKVRNENFFPLPDKSFNWIPFKTPKELDCVYANKKRFYVVPGVDGVSERMYLPSITTLLGMKPKPQLEAWKERLGPEEAARQCAVATTRGTGMHKIAEEYLLNEELYGNTATTDQVTAFNGIKKYLNDIDNIVGLEVPLYSKTLGLAGRCDCIAEYKGVPSIIDFKTSKTPKKKEWISDYFIQASFYSYAFEELTGHRVKQVVIIISNADGSSDVFVESRHEWLKELWKQVKLYRPQLVYSLE